jgi:hypothetical protein
MLLREKVPREYREYAKLLKKTGLGEMRAHLDAGVSRNNPAEVDCGRVSLGLQGSWRRLSAEEFGDVSSNGILLLTKDGKTIAASGKKEGRALARRLCSGAGEDFAAVKPNAALTEQGGAAWADENPKKVRRLRCGCRGHTDQSR